MPTVFMKLVGAIVVGGELVRPPAIVEVTEAEAVNLAHRGKAVPATASDMPTARTPAADAATDPLEGASEENPVDAQIDVGGQLVDVQIVGQDEDGTVVLTEASGDAIDKAIADEPKPMTASQKRAAAKAATAAAGK